MILPIYGYGQAVLKRVAKEIKLDYKGLEELIADMWETMYNANGVGLAAPQVGHSIRLFVVDTLQLEEEKEEGETTQGEGIKQVFINARKIEEGGEPWTYEEGCLSIPDIRGDVDRFPTLKLRYLDESFNWQEQLFSGINARVIQHEYDHIEGKLFTQHLKPIRRRLIKRKLDNIRKGNIEVEYKMKFANK